MRIKEKILKMPVWKAAVSLLILIFCLFFIVEEILVHTVFHVINSMMVSFEKEDQDDIDDMNDWGSSRQVTYCNQYKALVNEKLNLEKWDKNDELYPSRVSEMKNHQLDVDDSIKYFNFNVEKCKKSLKDKKL